MKRHNTRGITAVMGLFLALLTAGPTGAGETTPAAVQDAAAEPEVGADTAGTPEQETAPPAADVEALVRESQNPLSKIISMPFQGHFNYGIGPRNQTQYLMNIQPVLPLMLSEDILMINRLILPVVSNPGHYTGGDREWGLADTNYTAWLSPARGGKVLWGAGVSLNLPTATEDSMGTDRWAAGPSFVVVVFPGKWTIGGGIHNVWSFAGSGPHDVNNFYTQIFANYNIGQGWYVGTLPIITADWNAPDNGWMVPIGGTVGKGFRVGSQMLDVNIGYYHYMVRPDAAPRSKMMITFKLLWPKK